MYPGGEGLGTDGTFWEPPVYPNKAMEFCAVLDTATLQLACYSYEYVGDSLSHTLIKWSSVNDDRYFGISIFIAENHNSLK